MIYFCLQYQKMSLTFICFLRELGCVQDLSHTLQIYGLSDVCTCMCFFLSLLFANRLSQPSNSHLNGFSPASESKHWGFSNITFFHRATVEHNFQLCNMPFEIIGHGALTPNGLVTHISSCLRVRAVIYYYFTSQASLTNTPCILV